MTYLPLEKQLKDLIMKYVVGDLIKMGREGKFDIIVHGCNCMGAMGSGIAKQIRSEFPSAYEIDQITESGDKSKLGTYTSVRVNELRVVNAYTQYNYGPKSGPDGGCPVDYDAINSVMVKLINDFPNARIGIPKIGAGLAGGDWAKIENIIDAIDSDITCVIWSGDVVKHLEYCARHGGGFIARTIGGETGGNWLSPRTWFETID